MPKAIFGVLFAVAICAIAAGGHRSDPSADSNAPPEFVAPARATSINKSDKLQTFVESDFELPKQITEVSFVAAQQEPQPAPPISRPKQGPDFVPRHWHEPYASKPEAQKRASAAKKTVKRSTEKIEASVAKECPADGFAPFLRKLRLTANCDT
ncbi:hypothetical protein AB8Z38_34650 [Bradyrhizobium sp. LLZ17]|uniref:Uncharacterized protein n=1 Tax=Bradyrhizobium sp. LLZ17 TaxID=3239388 RepID=A0AB39XIM7_9BRAD